MVVGGFFGACVLLLAAPSMRGRWRLVVELLLLLLYAVVVVGIQLGLIGTINCQKHQSRLDCYLLILPFKRFLLVFISRPFIWGCPPLSANIFGGCCSSPRFEHIRINCGIW